MKGTMLRLVHAMIPCLLVLLAVQIGCSSLSSGKRDFASLPPSRTIIVQPGGAATVQEAGSREPVGSPETATVDSATKDARPATLPSPRPFDRRPVGGEPVKDAGLPLPRELPVSSGGKPGEDKSPLDGYLQVPHTAEEYVQLALRVHPDIRAASLQAGAEAQRIPQATALPDPVLGNTWWPISDHAPQTASGRMANNLILAQRFPWFGKLQRRGEVADLETQMALTRLAQTQLRVAEGVKQAYYDIFYNDKAINITQESDKLLGVYVKVAETRYKVGQVSQQDVLRIQVEQSRIRDQLITLRREYRTSQADLARLLTAPPETDLKPAASLDLPPVPKQVEKLYELAAALRPELRERLLAISRDQRKEALAKLEYYPDVTVGLNWQLMSTGAALAKTADGKDNYGLLVSMNLPIWHAKLQAGVEEARDRTAASSARYASEIDETFRLVRRLSIQARALDEQIALFRDDIVPKAEETLRVSSADYRVGKISVLQLLDNWGQLLRFRIVQVRLETSLGGVLASLERVIGLQLAKLPAGEGASKNRK